MFSTARTPDVPDAPAVRHTPQEPRARAELLRRRSRREPIRDLAPELTVFHHAVGDSHRALVEAGFPVELSDPGSADPEEDREQWSHKPDPMAGVPPTLVARAYGG